MESLVRVVGEGGVNKFGKALLGRRHRLSLGSYPSVTLEEARAKANEYIDQANRGINSTFPPDRGRSP